MDKLKRKEWMLIRSAALGYADQVRRYGEKVIPQQQAGQNDRVRITLIAMIVRLFQTQQAITQLVKLNLNDSAAAVLRGMFEQYFVFKALIADPGNLDRALEEAEYERRKALKGLREMGSERADEITDESLNEAIAEITAKRSYNVYEWAEKAGSLGVYHTAWRRLCTYAHACIHAIEKYVFISSDGVVQGINSVIEEVESIDFVLTSSSLLLEAVDLIDSHPATSPGRDQVEVLAKDFERIRKRFWVFSGVDMDTLK